MIRRATPDSEAVASSEDDVPWPHQTFGSLPRKENGVPGLGGGIWAQSSRGSFKLDQEARRMAARQAHLHNAVQATGRPAGTPSPTTSEGPKSLPFVIPLRPTAKPGRSLSHSQGQREMPAMLHTHAGAADRNGGPSLDLVHESDETDSESEPDRGTTLTQTSSHPVLGLYDRNTLAFLPQNYENMQHSSDRHRTDTFSDALLQDSLGSALAGMRLDGTHRGKQRWQTSSGWDELHTINESRRHSLAGELPTRRGSLAESHDLDHDGQAARLAFTDHRKYNDIDSDTFTLPDGYQVRQLTLDAHERADIQQSINMQTHSRPRKELYIVSFKCSRAGVFYLLDNTGLTVDEGNMVIVEADRGQDLGTVQHARVSPEEARALLQKYSEEQYKWLMMFSRNNQAGAVNPNAAVYGAENHHHHNNNNNNNGNQDFNGAARQNMPSTRAPREQFQNLKPKAIKRMAAAHEIRMLKEKEGNEAKAKRCCQQKVFQHHLDMEILESEFQWDWQKLIFYYYADHYVNFKELVNDLYKLYKVRLWMSAVNPASFSPNAINSPPSGIGPGAITNFDTFRIPTFDNSYAMAYGNDPDPYGAIPPYQVGYNTYVPNYPSIPGVPNSFAPTPGDGTPALPTHGQWPGATGSNVGETTTVTAPAGPMSPIGSPPGSATPRGMPPAFLPSFANLSLMAPRVNISAGIMSPVMAQNALPMTFQLPTRQVNSGRNTYGRVQATRGDQYRDQQAMSPAGWAQQPRPQFSFPSGPSTGLGGRQQTTGGVDYTEPAHYGTPQQQQQQQQQTGPYGSPQQSFTAPDARR